MRGPTNESVGSLFQTDLLKSARDKTLQIIETLAREIGPGSSENETRARLATIQAEMGAPKSWHLPQIRFGENTLLPFGKKGTDDQVLRSDDIFFLDLGPVFEDHEGDVGRSFFVGSDPEMKKCCEDVEKIWRQTRDHWLEFRPTGTELYAFAKGLAEDLGWVLALDKANGHRIADFPHAARIRGSIEEFLHTPAPNRWILEIQIRHPSRPFGAFFEDLLI